MDYTSFTDFALAPSIALALRALAFEAPTPIQSLAIPLQLEGADVVGVAATGSGKTAAYALPLIHNLVTPLRRVGPGACRALVLAPTRELALQIVDAMRAISSASALKACLVVGGVPRAKQVAVLAGGVDIVVATPGRLIDLMRGGHLKLGETRHLVIDEADRMLDLGFLEPVRRVVADLPADRQTVLFSATMPPSVEALASQLMRAPVRVEAPPVPAAELRLRAHAELVEPRAKRRRLVELLSERGVGAAIVFCRTRRGADALARHLARAGLDAGVMHSDLAQEERSRTLERFRGGRIGVLVATDLIGRGIDVPGVSHVINFDLPPDVESYVHRVGRTARAGAEGVAITFCTREEVARLRRIERLTGQKLLPRQPRRAGAAKPARQNGG